MTPTTTIRFLASFLWIFSIDNLPTAYAQQTVDASDSRPPPFCDVLPEPRSMVTLNSTTITSILLSLECGSLTNVVKPDAINFAVEEDPTATDILLEMNPPNFANPIVDDAGRLFFMANIDNSAFTSGSGIKLTIPSGRITEFQINSPIQEIDPTRSGFPGYSADLRLIEPLAGMKFLIMGDNAYLLTHFATTNANQPAFSVDGNNNVVQVHNIQNVNVQAIKRNATGRPNELSLFTPQDNPGTNINVDWQSNNGSIKVEGNPNATFVVDLSKAAGNKVLTGISCDSVTDNGGQGNDQLLNNECEVMEGYSGGSIIYLSCISTSPFTIQCNYSAAGATARMLVSLLGPLLVTAVAVVGPW